MVPIADCSHIILHYIALVVLSVAAFTPAWCIDEQMKVQMGLFKNCSNGSCVKHHDERNVARLVILAIDVAVFCAFAMTMHFILQNQSNICVRLLPTIILFVSLTGVVLISLGCIIYGVNNFGDKGRPGYSFILAVIGAILLLACGIVSFTKRF